MGTTLNKPLNYVNSMRIIECVGLQFTPILHNLYGAGHSANEGLAHEGPYQVEEAQFINDNRSYHFKPYLNLPTHYTPALRNHENFSYGGGAK